MSALVLRHVLSLVELSMALLTAPQGGTLLGQTLRSAEPMRAAMNAALAYVHSFTTSPAKVSRRTASSGVGRTPSTSSV
jgi:hypothetical protein